MRSVSIIAVAMMLAGCTRPAEPEQVQPQKSSMRNSPVLAQPPVDKTLSTAAEKFCFWNDKKYSDGAQVCEAKRRYKCWTDKWVDIGNC